MNGLGHRRPSCAWSAAAPAARGGRRPRATMASTTAPSTSSVMASGVGGREDADGARAWPRRARRARLGVDRAPAPSAPTRSRVLPFGPLGAAAASGRRAPRATRRTASTATRPSHVTLAPTPVRPEAAADGDQPAERLVAPGWRSAAAPRPDGQDDVGVQAPARARARRWLRGGRPARRCWPGSRRGRPPTRRPARPPTRPAAAPHRPGRPPPRRRWPRPGPRRGSAGRRRPRAGPAPPRSRRRPGPARARRSGGRPRAGPRSRRAAARG